MDEEVRFKQVELQNKLLDLFVDVPISLRDHQVDKKQHYLYNTIVAETLSGLTTHPEESDFDVQATVFEPSLRWQSVHERPVAATLLLNRLMQQRMPHVVIEGAPGQGKSTIAQYICQIHRMRLLDEQAALSSVGRHHTSASVARCALTVKRRASRSRFRRNRPRRSPRRNAKPTGSASLTTSPTSRSSAWPRGRRIIPDNTG